MSHPDDLIEHIVRRLREASTRVTVEMYRGSELMIATQAAEAIVRDCLSRIIHV